MSDRWAGTLVYSPLCDTDLVAYTRYLESNVAARGGNVSGDGCGRGDGPQDLGCGGSFGGGVIEAADIASGVDGSRPRGCVVSRGAVGLLRSFIAGEVQESVRQAVDKKYDEVFNGSGQRTGDCRTDDVGAAGTNGKSDDVFVPDGPVDASGASGLMAKEDGVFGAGAGSGSRAESSGGVVSVGAGVYVPPWRRDGAVAGAPVGAGKAVGKWYARNKAARDRRRRRKVGVEVVEENQQEGDDGSFRDPQSFFSGMPLGDVDSLKRSRLEAMKVKNEADRLRFQADVEQQQLRLQRLGAERAYADKDIESGAYTNRLQYRDEALDKKWQDQAENVQSYRRSGPVQGWVKTVVSGEGSGPSSPRSVPTLSSGGSPRSESDWELEVKRRDEENAQLRAELQAMIKENDNYHGSCDDYDSRNFNQPEHYGSTRAGDDIAVPWDQDSKVVALQEMMRSRPLVVK